MGSNFSSNKFHIEINYLVRLAHPDLVYKQVKSQNISSLGQIDRGNGLISVLSGNAFCSKFFPAISDYIICIALFSNTFYFDILFFNVISYRVCLIDISILL